MYLECIFGVSGENLQYDWVNVGGVGRGWFVGGGSRLLAARGFPC